MSKRKKSFKNRLIFILCIMGVAACLTIGLGSRLPHSPIPSWQEIYVALGLRPATTTPEGVLEVSFIDVGNADCTLIRQDEYTVLLDGGEPGDRDDILDYLHRHGVDRVELMIASHGHADHVGGLAAVMEDMPVDKLLVSHLPVDGEETDPAYTALLEAAQKRNVPVEVAAEGAVYPIGEGRLQILSVSATAQEENNRSIVARLTHGQRAFLFTGDIDKAEEAALLQRDIPLQADVLKIPHHGSNTASSLPFLRQVNPSYSVITCGVRNPHGHPALPVLERLQTVGTTVLRSDVWGDIVFTTDGETLTVETEYKNG